MRQLTVTKNDAGQRLDRFLAKSLPLLPDSLLQKYIRLKRVKRGGKPLSRDTRLDAGDILSVYINDEFFEKPRAENAYLKISTPRLNIIYEDKNIALIDKPVGMLCHPDKDWNADTLVSHLQAHALKTGEWNPKAENSFAPALCNRIDRNTGGIVIAAKNAKALRIMNEKIKSREIDKYYLCAVHGSIEPKSGRLEGYLFKDAKKNQVYVSNKPSPGAKTAATEYRTLCGRGGLSLLECRLLTGRTHQIRAQLAAAGHPLLGDGKYGSQRRDKAFAEKTQALWSYKIVFNFKTDAGLLEYLNGKNFSVKTVGFAEKFFGKSPGEF